MLAWYGYAHAFYDKVLPIFILCLNKIGMIKRFYLAWLLVGMYSANVFAEPPQENLQWKVFGHLKEARFRFGIVSLRTDRIMVIGGNVHSTDLKGIQSNATRTCEIIDLQSRTILPGASMNACHADAPVLQTSDSNVVILGGLDSNGHASSICEIYDRATGRWRILGALKIARWQHMAAFLNQEEILVVGGRLGWAAIAEAEIFNIRTGQSHFIANFPYKITNGVCAVSGILKQGIPIVLGGRSGGARSYQTANVYFYDVSAQQWRQLSKFIDGASDYAIRLFDGRLFFAGGGGPEYKENSLLEVSSFVGIESASGFSVIGKMLESREHNRLEQWCRDIIIIIGGQNENRLAVSKTEWFDIQTGQATEGPPLNDARFYCGCIGSFSFNNQGHQKGVSILVVGGLDSQYRALSSIEILETTNPQLIELPSAEIASRRLQQLLTSPTVIVTLTAFILVLIFALLYLLYQVFIIRRKSKFTWDGTSEVQNL